MPRTVRHPKNARTPRLASPSLRVVRLSGLSLTEGIESHRLEGVPIRVYSAAKTVADYFKFRIKIGLDIAIEAVKECPRRKKASINDIYSFAKICRVGNVIRPYMEALWLARITHQLSTNLERLEFRLIFCSRISCRKNKTRRMHKRQEQLP